MSVATAQDKEWLGSKKACRLFGVSRNTFVKVAAGLGIRCLVIPGMVGGRYSRTDILRAKEKIERDAAEVVEAAQREQSSTSQVDRHPKNETARPR